MKKTKWALVLLSIGWTAAACGSKESNGGDGDGDGDVLAGDGGGDGVGDGDGDGDSLDQGSLSANCAGLSPNQGDACEEPGLVCADGSGSSCVCGGFTASAGDGDDDFGRPGRPGNGDEPDPGTGQWECFSVGPIGTGGSGNMGGGDGSGGDSETGGRQAGGLGGDGPS